MQMRKVGLPVCFNIAQLNMVACIPVLAHYWFPPQEDEQPQVLWCIFSQNVSTTAIQNRLISGKSCHAQEQERVFNTITNITRATSHKKPGHIIGNIFLCLQAETNMGAYHTDNTTTKQQAYISKLAHTVPALGNTVFPFSLIKRHSSSWQAHLDRISDFLLAGKDGWWTSNKYGDIEFFDSKQSKIDCRAEGPKLHHVRSSNFKEEEFFFY